MGPKDLKNILSDSVGMPEKLKLFFVSHWRGLIILLTPAALSAVLMPFPPTQAQWVGYTLMIMASFWVTECIPLAVTAFIPIAMFPFIGIMGTRHCCSNYMNDTIMMFIGSLFISYSVEQSGLHKRLAYCSIQTIGYSHLRLLLAMCCVTTFASMWITNTAATTMMTPINFALLRVFEDQGVIVVYEKTVTGDLIASDVTSSYFCAVTFSATVGGIGTLVGTGTNLVFKGLFQSWYPTAPEYLSFPMFSAFAIPYMILLEIPVYLYMTIMFFGFLRPGSATAKKSTIPLSVQQAAAAVIAEDVRKKGSISYWEVMVVILFGGAMVSFFCRSPQMFPGWGDQLIAFFRMKPKFIRDSALAMFVSFMMFLFPRDKSFWANFSVKYREDLPKGKTGSVLDFVLLNDKCPYAFSFLLGGGFTLSDAANTSGLNKILGEVMKEKLTGMDNVLIILFIIIVVIFVTNFASNVAVCTVFTPIAMQLAENMGQNPLWYNIVSGYAASYCFMIPVGTPGNLIVQSAAKVPTSKMMFCGLGPTISTILITWVCMLFWAPTVWPDLKTLPYWFFEKKEK
ncbi:hypothetical protein PYW07_017212 [Mythimna separata]|uniref:Uncharacterized protein n=1 Tax=Mythimna separata TaxID=271217 RepID=A0AAD8DYB0_MYTSE|nr:hypothetical protein PYW07_017212 [Mythimna separata]